MTKSTAAMNLPFERSEVTNKNLSQKRLEKPKKIFPPIIDAFDNYLTKIGYAETSLLPIKNSVIRFIKSQFGEEEINLFSGLKIHPSHINKYEEMLTHKVNNNLISKHYRYKELHNVSLLSKYLYQLKLMSFNYIVPKDLKFKSGRSNEYVKKELITALCKSILSKRTDRKYRNLALILIMVDTGCRPIEIANITLTDVNLSEKLITFFSNKSGQRTIKIHPFVVKILKKYMETRNRYQTNSNYLFVKVNGNRMASKNVSSMFRSEIKRLFNQVLFSAKSLRHTFATNALENKIDLKTVSEAMGHKYWESTMHYLEKSEKRLLENTLNNDPFGEWGDNFDY